VSIPPNGITERAKQLERRADVNDEEHRQIWQVQGATNATLGRIEERTGSHREDFIKFEQYVEGRFNSLDRKFDKWSGRQWALMGVVIAFALAAIGNLLVLLSQRGSP
jgi:hypothetical protein